MTSQKASRKFGKRVTGPVPGRPSTSPGTARGVAIRLAELRSELDLTLLEFAQQLGYDDEQWIKKWFHGENPKIPSVESLQLLSHVFGISLNYLLLGVGPKFLTGPIETLTKATYSSSIGPLLDLVARRTGYDPGALLATLPPVAELELLIADALQRGVAEGRSELRKVNLETARRSKRAQLLQLEIRENVARFVSQESPRALETERGTLLSLQEEREALANLRSVLAAAEARSAIEPT